MNVFSQWFARETRTDQTMADAASEAIMNTFARRMAIKLGEHRMPKRRWRRQRHKYTHHAILVEEAYRAWARQVKAAAVYEAMRKLPPMKRLKNPDGSYVWVENKNT